MKPGETVRRSVFSELQRLGWKAERLRWKPEWEVPKTPHDLTKRERGQKYEACGSADLVAFADDSQEPHALQVIFEFKAPDIDAGKFQLTRYLASEPVAKMGYWTNGTETLAIYKRHSADWVEIKGARLPSPGDDLTRPPDKPPTWKDLKTPGEAELSTVLRRILDTVVASDARVNRGEGQLRELLHVMLVKLESDGFSSRSVNSDKPVDFRLYGDQLSTVEARRRIGVLRIAIRS